jgi:hypothetical protein
MSTLSLPAETAVRFHMLPGHLGMGFPYAVLVAPTPTMATPDGFFAHLAKAGVSAMLTHDRGCDWPDKAGEQLLMSTLETGGAVMMWFAAFADAIACHRRLQEVAQ